MEIEQVAVGQLRRPHIAQRTHDLIHAAGRLAVPFGQQATDLLALQVLLRAAQGAGDDREAALFGIARDIGFLAIGQRPDHHMLAIIAEQLGRHRGQLGVEEQVHQKCGRDIVAMVAKRDLGKAADGGMGVKRTAPQPRTQRAHRLAFGHHTLDHRIGVLLQDRVFHAERGQVFGQHVFGKAGLFLVQVHRDQFERHRRTRLQLQQDVEHGVAVLAAGKTNHDPVAFLDHAEIGDRLAGLAAQSFGELVLFQFLLAGSDVHRCVAFIGKGRRTSGADAGTAVRIGTALYPGFSAAQASRKLGPAVSRTHARP